MKYKLFLIAILISILAQGQSVKSEEKDSQRDKIIEANEFHYIPKNFDLSSLVKKGILKGRVTDNKSVVDIFNSLWDLANENGSNAFYLEQVEIKSISSIIFTLSIYSLNDSQIDSCYSLYPDNMIYIIGDLNPEALRFKPKTIKVNGIKVKLPPSKYLSYQNKVGQETTVGIGGLLGTKMWIKGKNERLPTYLSMNGFGVGPGNPGEIGVSFNTGRIYYVDINFGQFLVEILEKG